MVIAISNACSSYSESLQSYSYVHILVKQWLTCDTTTAVLQYNIITAILRYNYTAVLRYNYTCTTTQLQPYYNTTIAVLRYNYGHMYRTTTVLWQLYFCTTVQLLLHYAIITLCYVNFVLMPTVHS